VYRRIYFNPVFEAEYLLKDDFRDGVNYSQWTTNKAEAKSFTVSQAHRLVKKLNNGLDHGAPKRYGWDFKEG